MQDISNGWLWLGFSLFIIFILSVDTLLQTKHAARSLSTRAAVNRTFFWVGAALFFNVFLWVFLYSTTNSTFAHGKALDFLTGYLIEESLSIDNLFVFYTLFSQLRIPEQYQHRVFTYGIWSAVVLRLLLILLGTWLVAKFHWVLYVMGVFLLLTGIKILFVKEQEKDLSETFIIKLIRRFMRVTTEFSGQQFFVRKNNLLYATPLFVALIFIEISDIIFAFDSIPAIFAITQDPFIVWSSNIFAILGLRSMYFLLADLISRFHLLRYGIALILVFVGLKMVIAPWISIPVVVSLAVIIVILAFFTWVSHLYAH